MQNPDPLFRLFNEVGIIAQLSQTLFERVMPKGMTLAQFSVLNHFMRLGAVRGPAELARAFQVTKATMSSTLGRLEGKGLVEIRPDPEDGRAKKVEITTEGRQMHAACLEALKPELDKLKPLIDSAAIDAGRIADRLSRLRILLDKARA